MRGYLPGPRWWGSDPRLERVTQGELHIAHIAARAADLAEVAGLDVRIRIAPVRVVREVEGFKTELEIVVLVVGHFEVLQAGEIPADERGSDERIAPDVAVGAAGLHRKGRRVEGVFGGDSGNLRILAGGIRTIEEGTGVRRIGTVDHRDREARLDGEDRTQLPAARNRVQEAVRDIELATLAEREVVQTGRNEAVRGVEAGQRPFALTAAAVLGEQHVATLIPDGRRRIDRLRPGVRHDGREARGVALGELAAERVVVRLAAVVHQLNAAELGERRTRAFSESDDTAGSTGMVSFTARRPSRRRETEPM